MEVAAGVWLLATPLLFAGDHAVEQVCGGLIAAFGFCSFARALRHSHLLTGLVGIGMIAGALLAENAGLAEAARQNQVLTGLLAAMLAVVPNHAMTPPDSWRRMHGRWS